MTYKLIALDLDGTVLREDRSISPATRAAVADARAKGVEVMIVTGRHHVATLPYYRQLGLDTPAICCNGTYLYDFDHRQALAASPLDKETVLALIAHAKRCDGLHAMLYVGEAMTYEVLTEPLKRFLAWAESQPKEVRPTIRQVDDFASAAESESILWKFIVSHEDIPTLRRCIATMKADLDLSYEWSWIDHVDIARKGNSKGARLLEWATTRGIDASEILAIGDNHNDISMLSSVGMGVAMGNADETVKASAHDVTAANDDDGVARAIEKHVLCK